MYVKWFPVLSKMNLFQDIGVEELNGMLQCLKPRISEFKKSEYIAIAGENIEGVGIILKGSAMVIKENAAGNRIMVEILNPGDMFGVMAAFSGNHKWPASIHTQEPGTIMYLPPQKIIGNCEKVCEMHKQLIMNLLKVLSNKALILNKKVEYLSIKSMRGKISTFLLDQYKQIGKTTFLLPIKRNEMADFLNVSRPSMSREMSRMKDEGIIDFYRSSIQIINIEALRSMVET
ncbi:MAG: Crp/Fnr family transcriptional regulator [Desulfitobacteriaceae bacterium]